MPMPTPLKPFGKKLLLKLERIRRAAEEDESRGAVSSMPVIGKKMRLKLARMAEGKTMQLREHPPAAETLDKIIKRQVRETQSRETIAVRQAKYETTPRRMRAAAPRAKPRQIRKRK